MQTPDYLGTIQKGLTMKQMATDNKLKNDQIAKDNMLRDKKESREKQLQDLDIMGRLAGSAVDQPSYEAALAEGQKFGLDVSQLPQAYDPNIVKGIMGRSLSAKDRLLMENDALNRKESRDERRYLHGIARQDKLDAKAEKIQDREDQLAVPGYKRTGQVLPKPEEAMKLRKATASAEQLQSKLKRLKEIVSEKGSYEYGGEAGAEMDTLATEIQLLSKNEDMYQLGVLTGPDMKLLEKITASPTSLNSFFTRDSTRQKQIDTQMKSIADKLSASTKASGYAPDSQASAQQQQASGDDASIARQKRIAELRAKQEAALKTATNKPRF